MYLIVCEDDHMVTIKVAREGFRMVTSFMDSCGQPQKIDTLQVHALLACALMCCVCVLITYLQTIKQVFTDYSPLRIDLLEWQAIRVVPVPRQPEAARTCGECE